MLMLSLSTVRLSADKVNRDAINDDRAACLAGRAEAVVAAWAECHILPGLNTVRRPADPIDGDAVNQDWVANLACRAVAVFAGAEYHPLAGVNLSRRGSKSSLGENHGSSYGGLGEHFGGC
jgi:hypothetical protein